MTSRRTAQRALVLLLAIPVVVATLGARLPATVRDDATTNDHRMLAGSLRGGEYTRALELRRTTWRPNAPSALAVDVAAFAEVGRTAAGGAQSLGGRIGGAGETDAHAERPRAWSGRRGRLSGRGGARRVVA